MGIPRSIFLGRPLPAPGEPLWLEEDTEWALAWQEDKASRCGGCGHPLDETTDPDAEEAYRVHTIRCHACTARDRKDGQPLDEPSGVLRFVTREAATRR